MHGRPVLAEEVEFKGGSTFIRSSTGEVPIRKCLLVAAHPDDEVIGAGSRLNLLGDLTIVHVTDGAPNNMTEAARLGFSSRDEYSQQRRREFKAALECGGCKAATVELSFPDQEAACHLALLAQKLCGLMKAQQPQMILTHPYEGGHPDHDACAFAVRSAMQLIPDNPAIVCEFTSYHLVDGVFRSGEFLPSLRPVTTARLSPEEKRLKRKMFDCFETQREMLALFPIELEKYRVAPSYDFTRPPHAGLLHYEQQRWMEGQRFLQLAAAAAWTLGRPNG